MSDDVRDQIRTAVGAMVRDGVRPDGVDGPLWKDLSENGFHLLGIPEDHGGSGGDLGDLMVVIDLLAFHSAKVPVAENALAGWLLAQAGLTVPGGVAVVSLDEAEIYQDKVSGALTVPWGRHADHVVTLAHDGDDQMVAVLPIAPQVVPGENLAGEPRDVLVVDGAAAERAPSTVDRRALWRRGALVRSVQLAAAARAVLESARRHVAEREQFGRPLARFQAVQQQLAMLAAEVMAMRIAADAAVLAAEDDAAVDAAVDVAVAAAKATTSAGAQIVASIGHQLHGALGYSMEHHLGAATTRLWSWREEFDNESHWQDRLAAAVADGTWWPVVTGGAP